jgi:predicted metalloprotease with PDZ domain
VRRKITDLTYSVGMTVGAESKLTEVIWEGPAYKAGLTVGTQIIAVNGIAFDGDRLKNAIKGANKTAAAIELQVKNGNLFRTVKIDYHEGLRYPHLERGGSAPALLDQILTPRN